MQVPSYFALNPKNQAELKREFQATLLTATLLAASSNIHCPPNFPMPLLNYEALSLRKYSLLGGDASFSSWLLPDVVIVIKLNELNPYHLTSSLTGNEDDRSG